MRVFVYDNFFIMKYCILQGEIVRVRILLVLSNFVTIWIFGGQATRTNVHFVDIVRRPYRSLANRSASMACPLGGSWEEGGVYDGYISSEVGGAFAWGEVSGA